MGSALMLAREGATVVATDINEELLDDLANTAKEENLDITVKKVDVTCKSDILNLAEGLEKVDVLFNCAGYVHQGSIFDCTDDIFERSMNINVRSMFWICQIFTPKIPDGGSIINMSSVCSSIKGAPNRFAYGVTKAAVLGLTKSLAADLVGGRVRILTRLGRTSLPGRRWEDLALLRRLLLWLPTWLVMNQHTPLALSILLMEGGVFRL